MKYYKKLSLKWHPDKYDDIELSTKYMQQINNARDYLFKKYKYGKHKTV
jgi:curved DNA-binding protein CbpA